MQQVQRCAFEAHRHEIGGLGNRLSACPHPPVLHVEGDAKVLPNDHAVGDDLYVAATVGQQFAHRSGVVKADLVDNDDVAKWFGSALEHITHIAHVCGLGWNPPRPVWLGAGSHDHMIGLALIDNARPHANAVFNGHAKTSALGELVTNHVAKLGAIRNACGEAHLAAGLRLLFVDGYLMASACR